MGKKGSKELSFTRIISVLPFIYPLTFHTYRRQHLLLLSLLIKPIGDLLFSLLFRLTAAVGSFSNSYPKFILIGFLPYTDHNNYNQISYRLRMLSRHTSQYSYDLRE